MYWGEGVTLLSMRSLLQLGFCRFKEEFAARQQRPATCNWCKERSRGKTVETVRSESSSCQQRRKWSSTFLFIYSPGTVIVGEEGKCESAGAL